MIERASYNGRIEIEGIDFINHVIANASKAERGKFIGLSPNSRGEYTIVAVDNTDGNAWTEEFSSCEMAIEWLQGESIKGGDDLSRLLSPFTIGAAEKLSSPALLEQLAEEAAELAQAALKLARVQRGENPTPKSQSEAKSDLAEEVADVLNCLREVIYGTDNVEPHTVQVLSDKKLLRWKHRFEQSQMERI